MRCDLDFFQDTPLHLLYLARRLREALAVEMLLSQAEVEYYVEPGPYLGGLIFQRELTGAYFYVKAVDLDRSRLVLARDGYKPCEEEVLYAKRM